MKNIVAKIIKYLCQIYFVLKIYLWTINILLYRMKEGLMQIYIVLKKETYLQRDIHFKFMSYISL